MNDDVMILVTDETECAAVKNGVVKGEVYTDGEVYAERWSIYDFRNGTHNQAARSERP